MRVSKERVTEDKGNSKVSYDLYFINVATNLVVPEDTPKGTHTITFKFPTVLEVRDALEAYAPTDAPSVKFTINNYETLKSLAYLRWPRYLLYAVGLLLVALIVAAWFSDDNMGCVGIALLIGGLAFLFFVAKSVWNMWIVSPCFAIVFVLLLLIAVPRRIKTLFD